MILDYTLAFSIASLYTLTLRLHEEPNEEYRLTHGTRETVAQLPQRTSPEIGSASVHRVRKRGKRNAPMAEEVPTHKHDRIAARVSPTRSTMPDRATSLRLTARNSQ